MFKHTTVENRSGSCLRGLGFGVLVAVGMGLGSCSDRAAEAPPNAPTAIPANAPQVVATTSVLCDLTRQIAESTIALTCLMEPGQDPHTYQVKPSDRQALEQADLVLYDGYGYAPGVIAMVEQSTTPAVKVAVFEAAVPAPLTGAAHAHDHADDEAHAEGEDRDHGEGEAHDHADDEAHQTPEGANAEAVPDPHIWHSAANNGAIAAVIATHLKPINPDQATLYDQRATALGEQFAQLDRWIAAQVNTIPPGQRKLVTTHDSFRYFAEAYGLVVKGALSGLSTDEKPTPTALKVLVEQVKTAQVPAIFAETTTNPQLIEAVAKDAGVVVAEQSLFVEGPGGPGSQAETTQAMLVVNTCTVVEALGGSCNAAEAPL